MTGLALGFVLCAGGYLGVHSLGVRQIDPTNLSWLSQDPAQVFFGAHSYRFSSKGSALGFRQDMFGYPGSISMALFDPLPFVALWVRIASSVLPRPFQYDGLYLALCFVLQGLMGFALMRELIGPRRPAAVALGALLIVLAPVFVQRTYGHIALSSHWAILAAFALFFRGERLGRLQWWPYLALITVAAGLNVYISVMTLAIFFASVLSETRRVPGRQRLVVAAGAGGMVLFNLVLFNVYGFVTLADWPLLPTNDFGHFSANLLTLISAPSDALLLRVQPTGPNHSGEGAGYLGIGVIGLAVIALVREPRTVLATCRRFAPLVSIAVLLFGYATLENVRFGDMTVVTIRVPAALRTVIASLRANGRFIWPMVYLVTIITVSTLAQRFSRRALLALLVAGVLMQFIEVRRMIEGLRASHEQSSIEYAEASKLRFGPTVRNFLVVPPSQCAASPGPDIPDHASPQAIYHGFVTILNGLRSNSQYAARVPLHTQQPWCDDDVVRRLGPLAADTVYYFSIARYRDLPATSRAAHWCDVLFDGIICRADVTAPGESEAAAAARLR